MDGNTVIPKENGLDELASLEEVLRVRGMMLKSTVTHQVPTDWGINAHTMAIPTHLPRHQFLRCINLASPC